MGEALVDVENFGKEFSGAILLFEEDDCDCTENVDVETAERLQGRREYEYSGSSYTGALGLLNLDSSGEERT